MAKDPAMLWYWNDWNSGTVLLSRFLKGCYMDLLHAQFNNGRLTLEEIKSVLGSDFGNSWPSLSKKFAVDETGKYFNERCELEKKRRAEYVKSRSNGKAGKKKSYDKSQANHMINHTENENINENKDHLEKGVQGEKQFPAMPKPEDVGELPAIKIQKAIESLKIQTGQTVIVEQVVGMWDVFKIQNLTGKKYYSDVGDVESHFLNWITKKKFEHNGIGKTRQERTTSSLERLAQRGSQAIERIRAKDG
jgi:hypothetical protein